MAVYHRRRSARFAFERDEVVDYKDAERIRRFVTDRGKIIPRRISGITAEAQRDLTTAIKRARYLALLPYTSDHYV